MSLKNNLTQNNESSLLSIDEKIKELNKQGKKLKEERTSIEE